MLFAFFLFKSYCMLRILMLVDADQIRKDSGGGQDTVRLIR